MPDVNKNYLRETQVWSGGSDTDTIGLQIV